MASLLRDPATSPATTRLLLRGRRKVDAPDRVFWQNRRRRGRGDERTRKSMFERPVREWLGSDSLHYLRRVARRVAYAYHLSGDDVSDLYQELCLALWKAGPERAVNATWIFHTANHRAIELYKRQWRTGRFAAAVGAEDAWPRCDPEKALLIRARADRLPDSLRRFFRLRFQEGYTQQELMQRAHLTRGSIRGLEKECLRRLSGRRSQI
jgi:RNA polymerase sigma factor (sigma-70 family)